MKAKIKEKEKAILLRKEGKSVNEITRIIGCSKGSISQWVKHVQLTQKQKEFLAGRNPALNPNFDNLKKANLVWSNLCKKKREISFNEGRKKAEKKDPYFIAGAMLYWAEGHKRNNKNAVIFTNSDPTMMFLFISFLRKFFDIKEEEFTISIGYRDNGIKISEIEKYWLNILKLSKTNLRSNQLEKRKSTGYRKNILKYGICRLVVCRTDIIQEIYGAIEKISEPWSSQV